MGENAPRFEVTAHVRRLWAFGRYVVERFFHNGGTQTAASLTYTTLFAVVPLMTVTYSLLSAVEAFSGFEDTIQSFLFENFLPSTGAAVQEKLQEFSTQARQLTAVGFVFLVVTAYMMLLNVETAFNRIWSVREPRRGMSRFLLYWGVLTLSPLLLGVGFAISSYLFSLPLVTDVDTLGVRQQLLRLLPFALSTSAFTVLFAAVPNTRVRLTDALLGGLLCMLAYEGAKWGFARVMQQTTVEVIYGTFAAVPLFLIWIYLSWTIVLVGAEVTHALGARRYQVVSERAGVLPVALEFLQRVHAQHQRGGALPELLSQPVLLRLGPDLVADVVTGLERADVVCRDADGNWLPARDFDRISVDDVVHALPGYWLDADAVPSTSGWHALLHERVQRVRLAREDALSLSLATLFAADDESAGDPDDRQETGPDDRITDLARAEEKRRGARA